MWKVRAEITGDFVTVENFKNFYDAKAYADKLVITGIYDSVEFWEV